MRLRNSLVVTRTHSCGRGWTSTASAGSGGCDHRKESNHASCRIGSYRRVPSNSESQLKAAVDRQPVAVSVDGSGMQHYHSGVMSASGCCGRINHAVLVVGFGHGSGKDYWIVKNSWAGNWGESRYIRHERGTGRSGVCSIAESPKYPVAA